MAFKLRSLFRRNGKEGAVAAVYQAIVKQARQPAFYGVAAVPDTPTGRYAMVALHGFLVMDRLGSQVEARDFSQALFDAMFADMDRNLREMGVGDLSVGKKVKGLAQYFYAMSAAYREGMKGDAEELAAPLRRYVYEDSEPPPGTIPMLADYIRASAKRLAEQDVAAILGGKVAFASPPGKDVRNAETADYRI